MKTIPIDHVGCNVYETDRFKLSYKLTKGERKFAIICTYVLTIGMLFMLINWMLQVASD